MPSTTDLINVRCTTKYTQKDIYKVATIDDLYDVQQYALRQAVGDVDAGNGVNACEFQCTQDVLDLIEADPNFLVVSFDPVPVMVNPMDMPIEEVVDEV